MNPRIISDTTTNPWKYVTKIFSRSAAYPNADDAAYGTGILISNQIVLTAHHVLYHDAFGGFVGAGTSFAAAFNGLASIPRPFGTQTLNTSLGVDTNVSVDIGTAVLLTPVGILSQDVPGLAVFLNPADADGKAFMTAGFPSNVNSGQSMFAQDGTFGQTNAGITSLNGITLAIGQSGSPLLFNYEDHVYTVGVVHSFDDPNGNGTGDIGEPIYGTILTANLYKNLSDRLNLVESNTDSAQLPQNIIFGGSAGDSFTGSHRREKIVLLGGNDMADGYKGDDEIYGGDGDDALFGGLGDDTLDGGAGADTLDGGSGDDTLIGGDGADVFVIGKGADRIVGADATDRLYIRVGSLHPFAEERQHGEPLPEDALGLPVRGGFLAGDAEWSIEAAQRFPSSFALYDGDVLYDVIQGHGETGFYARFAEEFWRTVTTTSATKLQVRGRVARTPLRQRVITGLVPVISIACRRASGRMAGSSPAMTRDEWRLPCPAASARRFLDCGRRSPS